MIYSYSLINTFHEVCPRQAYERWWLKVKVPPSPEMQKGFDDHKALENRLKFGYRLPDRLEICEPVCESLLERGVPLVEHKMGVTRQCESTGFFDGDVYLRSVADVALYARDNSSAFIGDWKTGKKREDGEPLQLMILSASAFTEYPELETVAAANIYTQTGQMGAVHKWKRSEAPGLWRAILPLIHEIEQAEMDGKFPERTSGLCGWCPVFHCQHNRNPQRAAP